MICLKTNASGNCVCKRLYDHDGQCHCSVCGRDFCGEPSMDSRKQEQELTRGRREMTQFYIDYRFIVNKAKNKQEALEKVEKFLPDSTADIWFTITRIKKKV